MCKVHPSDAHPDQQDSQRVKSMIRVAYKVILKNEGKLTPSSCNKAMVSISNLEPSHEQVSTTRCVK